MKLENFTKEELICFIRSKIFAETDAINWIKLYRHEVEFKKYEEANSISMQALKEQIEIMEPYKHMNILDIPISVFNKLKELDKKHDKYDKIAKKHYNNSQKVFDANMEV